MTKPILGTANDRPLPIDLDRLIESRLLLQANSGGGKSWALRRLLEQTHGKAQHLVLDVEGEFHTLRERFDYVLAARQGGDTLADVRTAPLLARRLLELGTSAILDLYELRAHDQVRFVRLFLEALIAAPRELWHPVLVVVDEAHKFAPQKGDAESAAAVIDLMTRGRKRGFCGVLATQRLSKLHKDAAAEANVKLIGRAAMDVDMKRAAEELGFTTREDTAQLRSLKPGEFFAFGPGLSDDVVEVTIGPVETTHPKSGQRAVAIPAPRERVRAVLAKLADLPKEAEQEAKTLAELRAEVAALKRQLAARPTVAVPEVKVERVEVPVLKNGQLDRLEKVGGRLEAALAMVRDAAADVTGAVRSARTDRVDRWKATATPNGPASPGVRRLPARSPAPVSIDGSPTLGAERKLLVALAQRAPIRLSRAQLGTLCGLAHGGGTFGTYLSRLRSAGFIEEQGDLLTATAAGIDAVGVIPPAPSTPEAILEMWLENVGRNAAGKLLAELARVYPEGLTRADLGEACGIATSGGTFGTYLSRLRSNALIEERGGVVFASATVMGEVPAL